MRAIVVIGLVLALCGFTLKGPQYPDPFYLPEVGSSALNFSTGVYNGNFSWRDTNSKTLRTNQDAASYSGCLVLVSAGQSNETAEAQTSYTPTNAANVHNFNPFDGGIYAAVDPLLGATAFLINAPAGQGSYLGRLADNIINAGPATCVILVPLAVAGSSISDWSPGNNLNPRGFLYPRLKNAIVRLNSRGFTTQYVLWGQGEIDCVNGTSQAGYVALGNTLFFDLPSSVQKVFVAEQTYQNGSVCPAIQNAQTLVAPAGLINHSSTPQIWAGPNNDSLAGSVCNGSTACRYSCCGFEPDTHFTDNGNITRAANWKTALAASGSPFQ